MMKTLARYLLAVAGMVAVMLAVKLLILVPPERLQSHTFRKEERTGEILWGKKISADGHDEPSNVFHNNSKLTGELGGGVVLPLGEKARGEEALKKFNVNVLASDLISLNRQVPDSRPLGCESVQYPDNLPATAVVIPFHNEWPSVLLRTVYSLINRTPKQMLHQIILVDDASDLVSLKDDLDQFIRNHFPSNLVKLVRLPERVGLIRARLAGFKYVTAEVVSFFDSHMEVNVNWLQPLLMEIVKDRRTVAMGHLDYIQPNTFEYSFIPGYRTRYGFDWRLIFFETYFLQSQMKDKDITDPLPGVVMVGPGFAINADYFREMGTYDEGMNIWGGENLELAWRVWLCGGRLVHLACSKLGHIARPQPYSFPGGRYETEIHNYKRAIEVWMGPYKQLVYQHHPKMKEIDVGDLTERLAIRDRLKCNNFTWYLHNVWPELYPYGDNATRWGSVRNEKEDMCLDNNDFLFLGPEKLYIKDCNYKLERQSFALTVDHRLRSVLQCVGVQQEEDLLPVLITCQDEPYHTWTYTRGQQLKHDQTALCLQLMRGPRLVMQVCRHGEEAQMWRFQHQGQWSEKQDSLQMPSIPRKSQRLDSLLDRNHRTADVWHDQAAGRNLPPEAVGVKREAPVLWQQEAAGVKREGPVLWQQEENPAANKPVAQRNKVSSRRNAVARIHSRRKAALGPLGLHRDSVKVQVGHDLPVREDARWHGDSQMRNGDTGRWQGDSQMRNDDTGRWQGDSQMRNLDTGRWLKRAGRHEGGLHRPADLLSDRMQVGEEAGINTR